MMKKKENHTDYNKYLPYWKQVRVFIEGLKDVQDYLDNVSLGTDDRSIRRNKAYKERAKYTNFPSRTKNALSGAVFRKDPEIDIPSPHIKYDSNGAGLSLTQLAKGVVDNVIEVGRHGLFVDFDNDLKRSKILTYTAENIIDWMTDSKGRLSMVRLSKGEDKYKELILVDGVYRIDEYEDDELIDSVTPTKSDGRTLDFIPFVICGSVNNSPDVDDIVMWSIVDLTQGHYQNSADYEDLLRYLMPTPAVTVPNKQWMDDVLPDGVYSFGDGSIIPIPEGGNATLLQASPNQMHQEAMRHKEEQLVKIGARIISDSNGVETAEAVKIKFSSENSVLDNLAQNVSDAIRVCVEWCALFDGVNGEAWFELNREFFDTTMTPQEISALIMLADRGDIGKTDIRERLRKVGYITREDEEIDADAEENTGL